VDIRCPSGLEVRPGERLEFRSEGLLPDVPNSKKRRIAQIVKVTTVRNGDLRFEPPLMYDFERAYNARVGKPTVYRNIVINGLNARGPFFRAMTFRYVSAQVNSSGMRGNRSMSGEDSKAASAIVLQDSFDSSIKTCMLEKIGYYGVELDGVTSNIEIKDCEFRSTRHGVSINWAGGLYGEPVKIRVLRCVSDHSTLSGFDTHDVGRDIIFRNCASNYSGDCGFQARTSFVTYDHCSARRSKFDGFIARQVDNGLLPRHITVSNCLAYENGRFGINIPLAGNSVVESRFWSNLKEDIKGQ